MQFICYFGVASLLIGAIMFSFWQCLLGSKLLLHSAGIKKPKIENFTIIRSAITYSIKKLFTIECTGEAV